MQLTLCIACVRCMCIIGLMLFLGRATINDKNNNMAKDFLKFRTIISIAVFHVFSPFFFLSLVIWWLESRKKSSEIWHGLQACENVLHLFNDQSKRVMECVWVFVTCLLAIDGSWCDFDTWREHVDTNIIAHRHRTYTYHTHTGMKLQTNIVNAKAMKLTERTSCQVFENKWELCALNWLIKNCWSSLLLDSLFSITGGDGVCVCRSCCWLFFSFTFGLLADVFVFP